MSEAEMTRCYGLHASQYCFPSPQTGKLCLHCIFIFLLQHRMFAFSHKHKVEFKRRMLVLLQYATYTHRLSII